MRSRSILLGLAVLALYAAHQDFWFRDVAQELERMAARGQGETDILLGRARQVRQRLHQGVPEAWTAGR